MAGDSKLKCSQVTFLASLPPILSALKIGGDGGARIQFDVSDTDLAEVLRILIWRDEILRITIVPAENKHRSS